MAESMERHSNRKRKPTPKYVAWYGLRMLNAARDREIHDHQDHQTKSVTATRYLNTQCGVPSQSESQSVGLGDGPKVSVNHSRAPIIGPSISRPAFSAPPITVSDIRVLVGV